MCWVFVSVRGLSPVPASGVHSSSRCAGLSLSRPLLLRSTGSRRAGSVVVAHGPSRSAACGIFPDQGLNPCPLHWQADSQPLHHQGNPSKKVLNAIYFIRILNLISKRLSNKFSYADSVDKHFLLVCYPFNVCSSHVCFSLHFLVIDGSIHHVKPFLVEF